MYIYQAPKAAKNKFMNNTFSHKYYQQQHRKIEPSKDIITITHSKEHQMSSKITISTNLIQAALNFGDI